jgi:glyoxylase-like metal-dependent hydrolase (beta-lactamase superfamily II)
VKYHITNDPMLIENAYTVYVRDGGPCWIIDPGLPPQAEQILDFVREHDLRPEAILLTHAHADHIAGVDELLAGTGQIPVYLAREEWPMLADPKENLSVNLGMSVSISAADVRDLAAGMTLNLDGTEWLVGDVSGHSPGGRSLYCADQGIVIVGDGLFAGSVGRVDFHHSDPDRFIPNLRATLMSLPDETRVLPGHGPATTIGQERATNPFIIGGL